MMRQLQIWKLILQSIDEGVPVMLLYVLESKGSSPGRQGFFMAVNASGDMEGSIGGGIMEHKFVETAKEKLRATSDELRAASLKKQVHDKSATANRSGMICSGEQTIWLYPVKKEEAVVVKQMVTSLEENKNGTLLLSPSGIAFNETVPVKDAELRFNSEEDWVYTEKTGHKNVLYIIGGGHCSLALAKLMQPMGFYIQVFDDREGLKTMLENEAAHEKQVIDNYTLLKDLVVPGQNHYVVVMTFGYRTDDTAIKALLDKSFKYIGVLGSKKKMETLFAEYRAEGIEEALLQRIHTPIGLSINSQTPEEIAVSIAAQIINIKNQP